MMERRSFALSRKVLLKIYNESYLSLMLNYTKLLFATSQKHLVLMLDFRFDFIEHIDNKINKCDKIIGLMKRSSLALSIKILRKIHKNYPSLMLSDAKVQLATTHKYLVLILYSRLYFIKHIDNKISKCFKIVGMMKRRLLDLSRKVLLKIYNETYPSSRLNDAKVHFATTHKHLVLILDFKIDIYLTDRQQNLQVQQNYIYDEKAFLRPVKKSLAKNIQ